MHCVLSHATASPGALYQPLHDRGHWLPPSTRLQVQVDLGFRIDRSYSLLRFASQRPGLCPRFLALLQNYVIRRSGCFARLPSDALSRQSNQSSSTGSLQMEGRALFWAGSSGGIPIVTASCHLQTHSRFGYLGRGTVVPKRFCAMVCKAAIQRSAGFQDGGGGGGGSRPASQGRQSSSPRRPKHAMLTPHAHASTPSTLPCMVVGTSKAYGLASIYP
eukprot:365272-Chlamydomonas_euryale.AAC.2